MLPARPMFLAANHSAGRLHNSAQGKFEPRTLPAVVAFARFFQLCFASGPEMCCAALHCGAVHEEVAAIIHFWGTEYPTVE